MGWSLSRVARQGIKSRGRLYPLVSGLIDWCCLSTYLCSQVLSSRLSNLEVRLIWFPVDFLARFSLNWDCRKTVFCTSILHQEFGLSFCYLVPRKICFTALLHSSNGYSMSHAYLSQVCLLLCLFSTRRLSFLVLHSLKQLVCLCHH